jgi:hypothetical protein
MKAIVLGLACLSLAACHNGQLTPNGQAAVTTATPAAQTLATLAAANNKTINQIVAGGQLFCQSEAGLIGVVGSLAKPTSVVGISAEAVALACPVINGIQTTPAPVSAIPIVVSPTAAPVAAKPAA